MSKYRIGTIVRLRSGGPAMTVERPDSNKEGSVHCAYFFNGVLNVRAFAEAELEPSFPTERELLGESPPPARKMVQITHDSGATLVALDSSGVVWYYGRSSNPKWVAVPSTPWEDKE